MKDDPISRKAAVEAVKIPYGLIDDAMNCLKKTN